MTYSIPPEQMMRECTGNLNMFGHTYLPDYFSRPPIEKDYLLNDLLLSPEITLRSGKKTRQKRIAICGYRGWGKTTRAGFCYPLHRLAYNRRDYILWCSCTGELAEEGTLRIKSEIQENKRLQMFGTLQFGTKTADGEFTFVTGSKIYARGAGDKVRGRLWHGKRPNVILIDDLEDPRTVKSDAMRKDNREWFTSSLLKCVDQGDDAEFCIVYIGTMYDESCIMAQLENDPQWIVLKVPICDEHYHSLIPGISDGWIEEQVEAHRINGEMHVWYQEMMCLPISPEARLFQDEYFHYYTDEEEARLEKNQVLHSIVMLDPARTVTDTSCETAIVGASVNLRDNSIYFREVDHGRWGPAEVYRRSLDMAQRIKAITLAPETNSLDDFILNPLRAAMHKRGMILNLVPIHQKRSKEERVSALQPYFAQGFVKLHPTKCRALVDQLSCFPHTKLWDVMDCAANIVPALENRKLYFLSHKPMYLQRAAQTCLEKHISNYGSLESPLGLDYGRPAA